MPVTNKYPAGRNNASSYQEIRENILALLEELSSKILDRTKVSYILKNYEAFRKLPGREFIESFPAIYLLFEKHLTEIESESGVSKKQIRDIVFEKYPKLLDFLPFRLFFYEEQDQKQELRRLLLFEILDSAYEILGGAEHQLLEHLRGWITKIPNSKMEGNPFFSGVPAPETARQWTLMLNETSLRLHEELKKIIGREKADSIYESSYKKLAGYYSRLDTFSTVIGLLPDHLLDEEKLSLLSKNQTRRLLQDKIEQLQRASESLIQMSADLDKGFRNSESLLKNILPAKVAEELQKNGMVEPAYYRNTTVLFADLVLFTTITKEITPQRLVYELGHCFESFDDIVSRHNMEKIKTIGDNYMCAGGIIEENRTNAVDAVLTAMHIMKFIQDLRKNRDFAIGREGIRIGINTGPVMAGIVGRNRFTYDIWSDTVNFASRMEMHGINNEINISMRTREIVKDFFVTEYSQKMITKHEGEMESYLVKGIKPDLCEAGNPFMPNRQFQVLYQALANGSL